ncbi:hypothetical protein Gotri_025061 [Gossypium trilobum]|uniref:DUF7745 domain-containing protein n=2 Tax=Gossypium trilobum TaxID=34281 RepID=A0A7J9FQA7_9ROSI|nr:hypothetical protein [Gossypium trilobum]
MENGFLDKVEDNAVVQAWSETTQRGKGDLVPTVEEYMALLRCSKIQADRAYSRAVNVPTFLKKLINITGMSEQWVAARIKQKGDSKCIPWKNLKDLILAHPDTKKKVDVFALSVYSLVVFPKALRHDDISEEKWMAILQNIQEEDIEWRAPWMLLDKILYRCGNFDWVSLLRIWGAVGYTQFLVLRHYRSRQFVPATQGLAQCKFSYKGNGYKKKIRKMSNAWNQT